MGGSPWISPTAAAANTPTITQTFTNQGGTVNVACTGSTIAFVSAAANDGYQATTESTGPLMVEVSFKKLARNKDFVVESDCSNGTPVAVPPTGWGVGSGSDPNPGQF